MRRYLIRTFLPLIFCFLPALVAIVVAAAIETNARDFYINHITWMDVVILGIGTPLFILQTWFSWRALRWRGTGFDERADPWLTNLAQAAEWFPLMGLLGTVAGILQTFSRLGEVKTVTPQEIIANYAPAITATGSGLFMALINIFPTWLVQIGREMIRALGGADPPLPVASRAP